MSRQTAPFPETESILDPAWQMSDTPVCLFAAATTHRMKCAKSRYARNHRN